jgi:hypothetical protein
MVYSLRQCLDKKMGGCRKKHQHGDIARVLWVQNKPHQTAQKLTKLQKTRKDWFFCPFPPKTRKF